MILHPLHNYLVVRLLPLHTRSKMLIVPAAEETARQAVIEEIGPEVRDARVGETIVISVLAGTKVGEQLVIPETSILAHVR